MAPRSLFGRDGGVGRRVDGGENDDMLVHRGNGQAGRLGGGGGADRVGGIDRGERGRGERQSGKGGFGGGGEAFVVGEFSRFAWKDKSVSPGEYLQ